MPRHVAGLRLSLAIVLCLVMPSARAEDSKAYTVKLERPSKIGEKADVSVTATSKETTTVTFENREPQQVTKVTQVIVEGRGETLAIDDKGNETKASIKLTKAQLTQNGKTTEILPKGTVLVVQLKDDKTTFAVDGAPVSDETEEALSAALSLHDPRTHSDDMVFHNEGKQKVGASWPLDSNLAAQDLTVMGLPVAKDDVTGKSILVGVTDSDGVPCLHLQLEMDANNVKPEMGEGVTVTKGSMQMLLHSMVPIDEASQYGVASLATRLSVTAKRPASKEGPAATVRTVMERGRAVKAKPVQ